MMNPRIKNLLLAVSTAALLSGNGTLTAATENNAGPNKNPDRPNIIFIFTDDQGYADLGIHGHEPDVRTPQLDRLAKEGALFTRGYVTAPQCIPSRAGVITGRHQNAFGLDDNLSGPLSLKEVTIANRLQEAGYVTGMIGKWHLDISFDENMKAHVLRENFPDRFGFEEMFCGLMQQYHANFDLEGNDLPKDRDNIINDPHYRIDIQTRAALAFLDRRKKDNRPFFLYLAWFAPHSPIEGPPQYMKRLSHVEGKIRREALASILAIDDGLGMIRKKLDDMGIAENTLIIYISDNGAPLIEGNYIGSLNTPLIGEKGMLTDAGQRVPFIMTWPGKIPAGQVLDEMVWSLDASATVLAVADAPVDDRIEGVNLMPWLLAERKGPVHDALYWRWRTQAAILTDDWKFVRLGDERKYLFPTKELGTERAKHNVIEEHPEIAKKLEEQLLAKANTWATKGLPDKATGADVRFFDMHIDDNLPFPPMEDGRPCAYIPWDNTRPQTSPDAPAEEWEKGVKERNAARSQGGVDQANPARLQGWLVRQGIPLATVEGIRVQSTIPTAPTFLARQFPERLQPPVKIEIEARAETPTSLDIQWLPEKGRTEEDFLTVTGDELAIPGTNEWITGKVTLEGDSAVAILRILLEGNGEVPVEIRSIRLTEANGKEQSFSFAP